MRPLRLMVFDRTCTRWGFGLSSAWSLGSFLYRRLDRLDATYGASSWEEALGWLATYEPTRPIGEIQYWGHGRWGRVLVDADVLDASAFEPSHRLNALVCAVRERLLPDGRSRVWLRTCEAFGARAGLDFAERLADGFGAHVAGHTFIIGSVQSGLRTLAPGCRPTWSAEEGLAEGSAEKPLKAHGSRLWHPRTVSCLANDFPSTWLEEDAARR